MSQPLPLSKEESRPASSPKKRGQTRNKIIDTAENMFRFRGYEATSLNELVEAAGVSKGAFFHYYDNKPAIAHDAIDRYAAAHLKARLAHHLGGTPAIKEALFSWIQESFDEFKAVRFKGGCLLGSMALELSDRDEAARECIRGHFLDLENTLVSALRPLEAEGRLVMEARQFARLLLASLQGMTLLAKAHKDSNRAGREFMALAQMIEMVIRD